MMKKYAYIAFIFFSCCSPVLHKSTMSSVDENLIIRTEIQTNRFNPYSWQFYVPDTVYPNATVRKIIRVRYNFVKAVGQEHYFNQKEAEIFAKTLNDAANFRFTNNQKMKLPKGNNTIVFPIKLELEITPDSSIEGDYGVSIIEVEDLQEAYFNKRGVNKNTYSPYLFNHYAKSSESVLNLFVMEHHPDSSKSDTYLASNDGVGLSNYLKFTGAYTTSLDSILNNEKTAKRSKNGWDMVGIFIHELGHTLGLAHTWNENDGCDDTPRNPNCYDPDFAPGCEEAYSNNMMDYNNCQCSLTPCQIGQIHRNLYKDNGSQQKFVKRDWCKYEHWLQVKINESDSVVWSGDRNLYSDLILKENAFLEIKGDVHLPTKAILYLEKGATLFINGGKLYNDCNEKWKGIVIESDKNKSGKVLLSKTGLIENCAFEQKIEIQGTF